MYSISTTYIRNLVETSVTRSVKQALTEVFQADTNKPASTLSRKQTADLLNISLPSLNSYTQQGLLTSYKLGSRILYKENEVLESLTEIDSQKFKHK